MSEVDFQVWVAERRKAFPRFGGVHRVRIDDETHPMFGHTGVVVRECTTPSTPWNVLDGIVTGVPAAWVKMDKIPPKKLREFALTDPVRSHWIKLDCAQCLPL